jgi:hypothetical protein
MMVSRLHAMSGQFAKPRRDVLIVDGEQTTITHAAEILGRVKTKTTDSAHGSGHLASPLGVNCLGSIFNDWNSPPIGNVQYLVHRRTLPE